MLSIKCALLSKPDMCVSQGRKSYLGGSWTEMCLAPLCSTKRSRCWHSAPSSWAQRLSCSSSSAVISLWLLSLSSSIIRSRSASLCASWAACSSRSAALWLSCDHRPHRVSFYTTPRLFMCLQMIAFLLFLHLCHLSLQLLQLSLVLLFQRFTDNCQQRLLLSLLRTAVALQLLKSLTDKKKIDTKTDWTFNLIYFS